LTRRANHRQSFIIAQAIAACGGDARDAARALIVANEFLEAQVESYAPMCRRDTRAATTTDDSNPTTAESMENEKNPDRSNVHYIKRPKRVVSRTRLVMGLLLIVAIPIFIGLANKAVRENAGAIQQSFGR
jgi:hypothetical protein